MADDEKPEEPKAATLEDLRDTHAKALKAHEKTGEHLSTFEQQLKSLSPRERGEIAVGQEMQGKFLDSMRGKGGEGDKPKKKRAPIYEPRKDYE